MLVTALNLLLTAVAVLGFLALRRRWKATGRRLDQAEQTHAGLDRTAFRHRLHGIRTIHGD
ncbi:hypothetical protein J2S43_001963 [Catenuloplanes nepalensis]|uniref:Uncharacterized protein n=1 Tax=Catenuloplanes nepalensis TaxID=587533 RepID=A0ABT9MPV4_9ACTN|nr:hypothetical protein [Catenuloplanes nepalensis]MDP9793451.1 hypothetical protein [Catenuloplanes nepalensis]